MTLVGLFTLGLVLVWLERPAVTGLAAIVGLAGFVGALVLVVGGLWLYRRNARIFVRGTQIGQVDMWGAAVCGLLTRSKERSLAR